MKKQFKVLLLIAMICVLAFATMLVSSAALDAEQGENAWRVNTGETVNGYAATLADAIANATAGDTIYLLKDTTSEDVVIDKALTINGQGNKLVFTVTSTDIKFDLKANLTLDNIEIATTKTVATATVAGLTFTANDVVAVGARYFYVDWKKIGDTTVNITGAKTNIDTVRQSLYFYNDTPGEITINVYLGSGENKGKIKAGGDHLFRATSAKAMNIAIHGGVFESAGDAIYAALNLKSIVIDGDTSITAAATAVVLSGMASAATLDAASVAVIGSPTGVNKYGVADNVRLSSTYVTSNRVGGLNVIGGAWKSIDLYDAHIHAPMIPLRFVPGVIGGGVITIHDGTYIADSIGNSDSYRTVIYYSPGVDNITLTINGGQFSHVTKDLSELDPGSSSVVDNGKKKHTSGAAVTGCFPVYASAGKETTVNINGGYFYAGRSDGVFYLTYPTDKGKITMNITDCTAIGYRWVYSMNADATDYTVNIYGGNFMNSPGQPNCMGHVLQNASQTLNVYGGTFTVAQTGASAESGAITGTAGVTYNLYGGTFSSKSNTENSSMFYLNGAEIKMTIYAPGQSYVHPINGNSTSSGVTLEKANGTPSLINCGAAATVDVQGGTTIKLTNVKPNSLADVFVGATENLTYGNTGEHRLKFVLDNTPWFFTNDDAQYDFEVKSWGNLVLSAEGFMNSLTEYEFDGTFDGSYADLLALVEEYIIYELLSNDLTGFAHNEEYANQVSADRVNLTINISTVPAVILQGADITLRGADSTFAYTLFSVYADSKLSLIDCDFTAATTATSCPLVQVYEDGVTLVVEGGTYKAYGGYLFHVGTATKYEANAETTDVTEESVYKNSLSNTNVLFKDMDVYKLNGSYAFVLYGANLAEFNNVLVSFTEDYDRDSFKTDADLYPEAQKPGTSYTAIYSVTNYTKIVNSYLYMRDSSSAITTYSDKLDIINSTVVAYRWASLYNGTTNVYGGTWYNFPGQANASGFDIYSYGLNDGVELNIYGGNFTILRSQDPGQADFGTTYGVVYVRTPAGLKQKGVNIYGGNFKSEAHKSAPLFWIAKEGANITIYPAGTSYTNHDGQPATATVTNIVRQGPGSVVNFAKAGTVVLGNGTNVTLSEGASIYVNAEGAVLNAAGVNVTIGEGGVLPEDAEMWANTNFVLTGAADMAELIEGDNYTITDKASAIAAANAAFLRAYASNTYIKPNVNLTVALDSIVPFAVGAGAKLTLNWADLAYTGTFLTVNGGNVTIKAGNFVTNSKDPIVLMNSGTLTIDGGTFNRTVWADKQQYGLIEVVIGNLYINGGDFSVNDGTSIVWLRGTADKGSTLTEVTDGTFTCVGGGAHYSLSAIFFIGDSDNSTSSHVGVLNIKGGTFTGTGFVRIYAANYAENGTDPHETQKFVANISAGKFTGNADANVTTNERYMFQIARAGKHEMNFTKGTTATITAGSYGYFFNANASANGGVFNILGGTFDGAMCWINSGLAVTWNLDSVTFKDSQLVCTGNSDRMISFGGTDKVTITNCTFDIPLNIALIETNANTDITIEDSVIKASRFAKTGSAKSFTITNSLLVLHGNEDNVIEVATTVLDKVTIVVKKTATSAAPIAGAAKFANGAHPVVFYGGNEYYAWSTNKASNENASTVSGTAIYVDTAAESTSGIRFSSTVSAEVIAALTTGGKTLKFGTLVAPADYVAKAKAFTPAALDAVITSGVAYVTIPAVHSVDTEDDGSVSFSGILVNLKSNTRAYAAVSYIEVYEGETLVETIYSAYNTGDNATSAKFMADTILADEEKLAGYGEGKVAILNKYAAVAQ